MVNLEFIFFAAIGMGAKLAFSAILLNQIAKQFLFNFIEFPSLDGGMPEIEAVPELFIELIFISTRKKVYKKTFIYRVLEMKFLGIHLDWLAGNKNSPPTILCRTHTLSDMTIPGALTRSFLPGMEFIRTISREIR